MITINDYYMPNQFIVTVFVHYIANSVQIDAKPWRYFRLVT